MGNDIRISQKYDDKRRKIHANITNRANKLTKIYYALNKTIWRHKYIDTGVKMKQLKIIARKTKWDRIKNEDIRKVTKQEQIIRKLKWYRHKKRKNTWQEMRKIVKGSGRDGYKSNRNPYPAPEKVKGNEKKKEHRRNF